MHSRLAKTQRTSRRQHLQLGNSCIEAARSSDRLDLSSSNQLTHTGVKLLLEALTPSDVATPEVSALAAKLVRDPEVVASSHQPLHLLVAAPLVHEPHHHVRIASHVELVVHALRLRRFRRMYVDRDTQQTAHVNSFVQSFVSSH